MDKDELQIIADANLARASERPGIQWSCSKCGVSGMIDPDKSPEANILSIRETHRQASPNCINSADPKEE